MISNFVGMINGEKFTDMKEYMEALNKAENVKSTSVQYQFKGESDEGKEEQLQPGSVKEEPNYDLDVLYPQPDIDELVDDIDELNRYTTELGRRGTDHHRAIESMSNQDLQDHLNNLEVLATNYNESALQNAIAMNAIKDRIDLTRKNLEKLKTSLHNDEDKLNTLENSDNLFRSLHGYYEMAIRQTKAMINNRMEKQGSGVRRTLAKKPEFPIPDYLSGLRRLATELFS